MGAMRRGQAPPAIAPKRGHLASLRSNDLRAENPKSEIRNPKSARQRHRFHLDLHSER
jgi:hypothetical protein